MIQSAEIVTDSYMTLLQVGAIGAVCVCLLVYVVWNQKENTKERNTMREEMLLIIKEANAISNEYSKNEIEQRTLMKSISDNIQRCYELLSRG